ncbi:hypothetical protein RCL1_007907 [Eukaryota sp. TZLM3-RCL]
MQAIPPYLQDYFQKLVYQLLNGCGRPTCTNSYCASSRSSSKPKDINQAAVMAINLLRQQRLDLLCPPITREAALPSSLELMAPIDLSLLEADESVIPDILFTILSSPAAIISNFYFRNPGDTLGLDIERCDYFFSLLTPHISRSAKLQEVVTGSVHKLLTGFTNTSPPFFSRAPNYPDAAVLRCVVVLWLFPILSEPDSFNATMRLTGVIGGLSETLSKLLANWIATLPASYFKTMLITCQQQLTILVARVAVQAFNVDISNSRPLVQSLSLLFQSNLIAASTAAPLVDVTEFYNDAVNSDVDLRRDTVRFINNTSHPSTLFVGPGPFLLNPRSKADVIQTEARIVQHDSQQQAMFSMFFSGPRAFPQFNPYLVLKIHRENLLSDTLNQLSTLKSQDLKKQLRVQFVGEPGVDEGGLRQELFGLVMKEILDEKFGMFYTTGDNTLRWFSLTATDMKKEYELTGVLVGLAFFNGITVDLRFPRVVWKKLLGFAVGLPDLQDIDYELTHGLNELLAYPGDDVEEVFCRNWTIEREVYGSLRTFELVPNGSNIPVTSKNKVEFVNSYVKWILEDSIRDQFEPFKHGFQKLFVDLQMPKHLSIQPYELELIVCGEVQMDFKALERRTAYDGYSPSSPTISMKFSFKNLTLEAFWRIVHDLPAEQQRKLLQFVTGTDRVPVGGLSNMKFVITRSSSDAYLPTAHTCFNVLCLPDYQDENKIREKLLMAIQNSEGFGLI